MVESYPYALVSHALGQHLTLLNVFFTISTAENQLDASVL